MLNLFIQHAHPVFSGVLVKPATFLLLSLRTKTKTEKMLYYLSHGELFCSLSHQFHWINRLFLGLLFLMVAMSLLASASGGGGGRWLLG
jgi:hypothetical protein